MSIAARLYVLLRGLGLNVVSVSVGREGDRTTWRVQPDTLQAQAQAAIDAFVIPNDAQLLDEEAQRETSDKKLQAAVMGLWECIPSPTMTKLQLRNRIVAIYKTL
jgi:hypothetical protein